MKHDDIATLRRSWLLSSEPRVQRKRRKPLDLDEDIFAGDAPATLSVDKISVPGVGVAAGPAKKRCASHAATSPGGSSPAGRLPKPDTRARRWRTCVRRSAQACGTPAWTVEIFDDYAGELLVRFKTRTREELARQLAAMRGPRRLPDYVVCESTPAPDWIVATFQTWAQRNDVMFRYLR